MIQSHRQTSLAGKLDLKKQTKKTRKYKICWSIFHLFYLLWLSPCVWRLTEVLWFKKFYVVYLQTPHSSTLPDALTCGKIQGDHFLFVCRGFNSRALVELIFESKFLDTRLLMISSVSLALHLLIRFDQSEISPFCLLFVLKPALCRRSAVSSRLCQYYLYGVAYYRLPLN